MKTNTELRQAQIEERIATVGLFNRDYAVEQISGTLQDADTLYRVAGPAGFSNTLTLDQMVDLVCCLAAADIEVCLRYALAEEEGGP